MLAHPTLDKLKTLRLLGMAKALKEQHGQDMGQLSFEERLGLLVDREVTERENKRLSCLLKKAKLKQAAVESLDFSLARGIDKSLIMTLATGQWIARKHNLLITGPTGVGKSFLACALAHKACLLGFSARYCRLPRILEELRLAKADGRYPKVMIAYAKINLLILDDWGLTPFSDASRRDLLELIEDRYQVSSTIVASQLPIEQWHESIGDPTLADAILDRLIHNAYKINLKGDSMRKKAARSLTQSDQLT